MALTTDRAKSVDMRSNADAVVADERRHVLAPLVLLASSYSSENDSAAVLPQRLLRLDVLELTLTTTVTRKRDASCASLRLTGCEADRLDLAADDAVDAFIASGPRCSGRWLWNSSAPSA